MTTALVVGHGSIGARHARLLGEMGLTTHVVSRRPLDIPRRHPDLERGLAAGDPGYVVLANRTSEHAADLARLADLGYRGRVLVEKPLFKDPAPIPGHGFASLHVGYQLRFHPVVTALRHWLKDRRLYICSLTVGQDLADWRPGTDYRDSYSASRALGGGVLRDLSHELDLALWLFGPWRRMTAAGGHLSDLETDAEDAVTVVLDCARCPLVTVQLNCLDQPPRREITVRTDLGTVQADLVAATIDGTRLAVDRDDVYLAQHRAILEGGGEACTGDQGLAVDRLIAAAERAMAQSIWVQP